MLGSALHVMLFFENLIRAFLLFNWVAEPLLPASITCISLPKSGAHLLLQTRVKTLDGELGALFKRWYPDMDIAVEEMPAVA